MPRYFFHFASGNDVARDTEGVELEGLGAAYLRALEMLHRVHVKFPDAGNDWVIEVGDVTGRSPLVVLPQALRYRANGMNKAANSLQLPYHCQCGSLENLTAWQGRACARTAPRERNEN